MAFLPKGLAMLQGDVKITQAITEEHIQGDILIMHDSTEHTIQINVKVFNLRETLPSAVSHRRKLR